MAQTEPIREKRQLQQLAEYYHTRQDLRDWLLIVMGVHTALRIGDLLRLQWDDVYDFKRQRVRSRLRIVEGKTKKARTIALNPCVVSALEQYVASRPDASGDSFLFCGYNPEAAIHRTTAWRVIRRAAEAIGVEGNISCHSLRKSFGYHAWQDGIPLAVITDIFNHSSYAITRRYLGITQDDCDKAYLSMCFFEG